VTAEGDKGDVEGDDLSSESEEGEDDSNVDGNEDERDMIKAPGLLISGHERRSVSGGGGAGGGNSTGGPGNRGGASWRRGRTHTTSSAAAGQDLSSLSFGLGTTSPLLPSRPSPDNYQHCFKLEDSSSSPSSGFHEVGSSRSHHKSSSGSITLEETLIKSLTITKPKSMRVGRQGALPSSRARRPNTTSLVGHTFDSQMKGDTIVEMSLPEGSIGGYLLALHQGR